LLIWTFEIQIMARRKAGSQTSNLILDRKKSGIEPIYLSRDGVRHTVEKLSTRDTILLRTTFQSEVCSQSYEGSKVTGVPTWAISRLPLGCPETKNHLDVGPVERCRVNYKGEGDGFPQVRAMVNLVCPCCPWLILAPKVFQLCTNHIVWVVCKPV
jgi:hypothetical protein